MNRKKDMYALLEMLAELEHKQWREWSQNIAKTENISEERLNRWAKMWIPYEVLTEEQKEQDRVWARKTMQILKANWHFFFIPEKDSKKFLKAYRELKTMMGKNKTVLIDKKNLLTTKEGGSK